MQLFCCYRYKGTLFFAYQRNILFIFVVFLPNRSKYMSFIHLVIVKKQVAQLALCFGQFWNFEEEA